MSGQYGRKYFAYTVSMGVGSFALLLYLTLRPDAGVEFDWPPLAIFAAMALVTKFLSFRMMRVVTLSMDTAVYITAILCLGVIPAAWTVFLSMYVKIVWDTVERELLRKEDSRPFLENVTAPLFQGGTGALAVLLACSPLPVEAFVNGALDRHLHVFWLAPALAALFVVVQYTLVLNKYFLRGYPWKNLLKEVFLPGLWTEMILVPLAMVMAVTWHSLGAVGLPFLLLLATYLMVNLIFKRLSDATTRLDGRIRDLESLNELGRTICATLQAGDLVPALAQQSLRVFDSADGVLVQVWNDESSSFESHALAREGEPEALDRQTAEGLASRIEGEKTPLSTFALEPNQEGVRATHLEGRTLATGSWMGIPIRVYDQTIGVLVLHARSGDTFGPADLKLLGMIGQQAAVALQNSRLYVLATVDGLTRLFVRRYFDRRLDEEVARAQRYGTSFSVMLVDFDEFKEVNDTFGHAVGDRVLRRVADILLSEVRNIDLPARFGGDEYAVILPEVNWRGAMTVAQRLMHRVRREPVRADDQLVQISVSIGMASFPEHGNRDSAQILAEADKALYRAKSSGKGRIVIAGEEAVNTE